MIVAIAKARSTLPRSELGVRGQVGQRQGDSGKAHNATTVRKPIRRQLLSPKSENSGRDDNAAATPYQITCAAASAHNQRPVFLRHSSARLRATSPGSARHPAQ